MLEERERHRRLRILGYWREDLRICDGRGEDEGERWWWQ